jgi:anti-sigma factor RsiW
MTMDETTRELLSRHLDGDLDPDEELRLSARLEAEPALASELDIMRRIQGSIAELASRERAPIALDAVMQPLLRSTSERLVARPWVRWLATAAVVLVGATVVIEINRRNPGPTPESLRAPSDTARRAESGERFSPEPVSTGASSERQPAATGERLAARPDPGLDRDGSSQVVVPGSRDEKAQPVTDKEKKSLASGPEAGKDETATDHLQQPETLGARAANGKGGGEPPPEREETIAEQDDARGAALRSWDSAPPVGRAQLFVFIDGKSAWREFTPTASCRPGRYSVRIVVADGAVREARPVGGAAAAMPSQRLCAATLIRDLEIDGVADGEYPAEVVVEPRRTGD